MKILTIDGNNLVHRVYWVANNIKNVKENYHVYMFLNSVKSYVELYKPDKTFMVWDEKPDYRPNKRKELLKEYKGNRNKDYNVEVHSGNELIKELLQDIGIPSIFPREYEADDVIGIIDKAARSESVSKFYLTKKLYRHIIITVDRDLCQLINEKVSVYDPIRKYEINNENFEEKLKYKKEDFIKVKALQGDKSDNIPGIKGMGKVKTEKYLKGEVELTNDEIEIYNKNLQLVKLTNDSEEVNYVNEQIYKASFDTNWDKFLDKCKELKFNNILKKDTVWYNTFFQDNRLIDLLS
tara:strand:- start:2406 stop:3290 length:885 start_codon:yes stop_codon:yes gene_type:complete